MKSNIKTNKNTNYNAAHWNIVIGTFTSPTATLAPVNENSETPIGKLRLFIDRDNNQWTVCRGDKQKKGSGFIPSPKLASKLLG